jgi:hypothetical protein
MKIDVTIHVPWKRIMKTIKRLLGVLVLLLSVAGLVICVAGIIGAWKGRAVIMDRGEQTYERVDNIFARVQSITNDVRGVLQTAAASLREVKDKRAEARGDPQKEVSFSDWAARAMARDFTAKMGSVQPMLEGISDAVVVAHSVLSELEQKPPDSELAQDRDRLQTMNQRVVEVGTAAQKLTNLLGQPNSAGDAEVENETALVEQKLQQLLDLVNDFADKLTDIRDRAAAVKARVTRDLFLGAIILTVLLSWFALSQISLMAHAWSWIRSRTILNPTQIQRAPPNEGERT